MILISKEIAKELNSNYGVIFGEGGISKSKSKHPKYYLCESKKNIQILQKLQTLTTK